MCSRSDRMTSTAYTKTRKKVVSSHSCWQERMTQVYALMWNPSVESGQRMGSVRKILAT